MQCRQTKWLLVFTILGLKIHQNRAQDTVLVDDFDGFYYLPPIVQQLEFLPSPRIVGGSNAAEGQFPYQISLRQNGQHICGGSIVSANFVITAAHCVGHFVRTVFVTTPARLLSIRAGSNLLNSGGVVVPVAKVRPHPNFFNNRNDIALLKLAQNLVFDSTIAPIEVSTDVVPIGATVLTTGWGRIRANSNLAPNLQVVELTAITNLQCRRFFRQITSSILCLDHNRNAGVCFGDSGGPAIHENHLVGVTNFVLGTCGTTAPDGYARISSFIPWIVSASENTVTLV